MNSLSRLTKALEIDGPSEVLTESLNSLVSSGKNSASIMMWVTFEGTSSEGEAGNWTCESGLKLQTPTAYTLFLSVCSTLPKLKL